MGSVVLLDLPEGMGGEFDRSFLERNGLEVQVCHGPAHGELCPILSGHGCDLFGTAHGVVFALDLDRPQHRAILDRYRKLGRTDMPLRVVTTREQARDFADVLVGLHVWTHDPTAADLDGFAAEVEAADRGRVDEGGD